MASGNVAIRSRRFFVILPRLPDSVHFVKKSLQSPCFCRQPAAFWNWDSRKIRACAWVSLQNLALQEVMKNRRRNTDKRRRKGSGPDFPTVLHIGVALVVLPWLISPVGVGRDRSARIVWQMPGHRAGLQFWLDSAMMNLSVARLPSCNARGKVFFTRNRAC